jgi:hypothetical protein
MLAAANSESGGNSISMIEPMTQRCTHSSAFSQRAGAVKRMGLDVVIEGVQRYGVKVSESKA